MAPKRNIVWLASYPKSGNTWMRIFLANYLFNPDTPMPINQVHRIGIGDAVPKTYAKVADRPIDPSDPRQTVALRPRVLASIAGNNADINFVKTHNARTKAFGVDLIPAHLTHSAIYIMRHPLDVACSFARHYAQTIEETIAAFDRADHSIIGDSNSVPQFLGSWAEHVRGWTRHRDFPVLLLRYEDLLARPHEEFARVVQHIGAPMDEERLDRAVRFSSFDEVSAQEAKHGFIERSPGSERFFHSGGSGAWRDTVPDALASRFAAANAKAMSLRGYAA
ncbi:MAG: sulfotransferase domain-containing protein [Pseudomonadota bacterium]